MTHEATSERPEVRIPLARMHCRTCQAHLDVPQFPGIEAPVTGRCIFCGQTALVELAGDGPPEWTGRHVDEPSSEERFHELFQWWVAEEIRRDIRQHWTFRADRWIQHRHANGPSVPFTPAEVFASEAWARCVYLPFWLREGGGPGEAPSFVYAGRGLPEALLRQLDLGRCLEAAPPGGSAQLDLLVEPVAGETDPAARLVHIPLWIAAYVEGDDAFRLLLCPRTGQHVTFEPPLTQRQLPDGRRWLARQVLVLAAGVLLAVALYLLVESLLDGGDTAPPPPTPLEQQG